MLATGVHIAALARLTAIALAGLATLAFTAAAQAAPQLITRGLTEPGGLAITPDHHLWVSDGNFGICRLDLGTTNGTVLDPIVQDGTWCAPPERPLGPEAATQLAFDPASASLYVGDRDSTLGGVWRLPWDSATGTVTGAQRVYDAPGDRVQGLAVAPGGGIDFTTKRGTSVLRMPGPDCGGPFACPIAGSVLPGSMSLAHLGDDVYLAESTGVTVAHPSRLAIATPVDNFPGGVPNALAVDASRGRVYAGTANPNGDDQVDVLDTATGDIETYATGFAAITAMTVDDDGTLYVADDPAGAAAAVGVVGQGRLWKVPDTPLGRPHVTAVSGPSTYTNQTGVRFAFESAADTTFTCSADGAAAVDCGSGPASSFEMSGLSEGLHTLEVRATDSHGRRSDPLRRSIVVDLTPPAVLIENTEAKVESSTLAVSFTSPERNASFACSLDGGAPMPCDSPSTLTGLSLGRHTFSVGASDPGGNAGAPAVYAFDVVPAPRPIVTRPALAGSPATKAVEPPER